jgi:putative phosphoribosyl transferase
MMGERPYRDRAQAGEMLAGSVRDRLGAVDAIVLALPRGGLPIGLAVARALDAPLDVLIVRKLGVPAQPELAMGAIASGGFQVLDKSLTAQLGLTSAAIAAVVRHETAELHRREALYRGDRPPVDVRGRVAILVDDGLATGSSMRAAIGATRQRRPHQLVVAVPVGARDTCEELAREVDTLICPLQPREFFAVGQWYEDFAPTTDDEVRACLAAAPHPEATGHIRRPP